MHDSRGAELRVGDRVLIEAEVTMLATSGDENFCCVDVLVVTPDQPGKEKVMQPATFSSLSTRMLTKVGACVLALVIFAAPSMAQDIGSASTQSDREILLRMAVQLDQVSQVVASMQKSVDNHTAQLAALSARVDAIQFERSSVPATATAPAASSWGTTSNTQSGFTTMSPSMMQQQGYGGMGGMMQSGGVRRGIFARRGGCGAGG